MDESPAPVNAKIFFSPHFIHELVLQLNDHGAIYPDNISTLFLFSNICSRKSSCGNRLILKVSELNKLLIISSFKASNHVHLNEPLIHPAWMTTHDIKDAYLHIPILPFLHTFLVLSYVEVDCNFFGLFLSGQLQLFLFSPLAVETPFKYSSLERYKCFGFSGRSNHLESITDLHQESYTSCCRTPLIFRLFYNHNSNLAKK